MSKRKQHPSKIKAVPPGQFPAAAKESGDEVRYIRADELSEDETIAGLMDGTIRAWKKDASGEQWVQVVPRSMAYQTIANVSPDHDLLAAPFDADAYDDEEGDDD